MKAILAITRARHEIATASHSIYGWVSLSTLTVFVGDFLSAVGLPFAEAKPDKPTAP